jgi:hypothetical protein
MKIIVMLALLTSCAKILDTKDYIILSEKVEIRCKYHEEDNEYSDCVSPGGLKLEKVTVMSGFIATIPNRK